MTQLVAENVVANVTPRQVKNGTQTVYDVTDTADVKWTAWERELAEQAWALKGVPALWKVDISQNGTYTNRTLKGIEAKPTEGFGPALGAMEAALGSGNTSTFPADVKKALTEEPSYKVRNIWRQTASKVAAHMSNTPLEFWANIDMLVLFYETGEKPSLWPDGSQMSAGVQAELNKSPFETEADTDIPFS